MSKVICIITIIFIFSCSQEQLSNDYLGIWTTITNDTLGRLEVTVRLEDSYGNIPTGARVMVKTPNSEVSWLSYSSETNTYNTYIPNSISGDYSIIVKSVIKNIEQKVPYTNLSTPPTLLSIKDSSGSDYFNNEKLHHTQKIMFTWEDLKDATVYKGNIKNESNVIAIFSTSDSFYILDVNSLESNKTYSIELEAQSINGNPYFIDENFYTYSSTVSSRYDFSTN